jgi:hypothetical protein
MSSPGSNRGDIALGIASIVIVAAMIAWALGLVG